MMLIIILVALQFIVNKFKYMYNQFIPVNCLKIKNIKVITSLSLNIKVITSLSLRKLWKNYEIEIMK